MLNNSLQNYGLIAKLLHWSSTVTITLLFSLGWWMVDLHYYDNWYTLAPHYHNSVGILLSIIVLLRVFWRLKSIQPLLPNSLSRFEKSTAHWTHRVLYIAIFFILITGYLIPTADGRGIEVFHWFSVPSLGSLFNQQEDIAGTLHFWSACGLMLLAAIHALASLKHHFIDKDNILKRML